MIESHKTLANKRPRVDAGWPVLFTFQRAWPRATKAERWASFTEHADALIA